MRRALMVAVHLAILAVLPGTAFAAPYTPPAEDAVVIRRDRIPLDTDEMADVSRHLLALAQVQGGGSGEVRRSVAQMLALALVLQPGDPVLIDFGRRYADGFQDALGKREDAAAHREALWRILGTLSAGKPGEDARILAGCLGDVLLAAAPEDPQAKDLRGKPEQTEWSEWIAPLAAFQPPAVAETDPAPLGNKVPDPPPVPVKSLARAAVETVVWESGRDQSTKLLHNRILEVNAVPLDDPKAAPVISWTPVGRFPEAGDGEKNLFRSQAEALVKAATNGCGGSLAHGTKYRFTLKTKEIFPLDRDGRAVSAAVGILLRAMASGKETGGTILGELSQGGELRLPTSFWLRLRALPADGCPKVVVPAAATALLPSLLALEEPGFFLDHEVLLASDFRQMAGLAAFKPEEEVASVCAKFAEIVKKRGNLSIPSYVANRYVRQRLEEIVRIAPWHGSARMLALQAAGQRPAKLAKPVLAAELLAISVPGNGYAAPDLELSKEDAGVLSRLADTSRDRIQNLFKLAEFGDRPLLDEAMGLSDALRSLSRGLRKKSEFQGLKPDYSAVHRQFIATHSRVTTLLREAAGLDH